MKYYLANKETTEMPKEFREIEEWEKMKIESEFAQKGA